MDLVAVLGLDAQLELAFVVGHSKRSDAPVPVDEVILSVVAFVEHKPDLVCGEKRGLS